MNAPTTTRDRMHLRRWELGAAAVLALLCLVLAWDWNWLKGPIERRVEAVTGRSFEIQGGIEGRLGSRLQLRLHEVRLGNTAWGQREHMGLARVLEVELGPADLLRRRVHHVGIERLRLSLERNADGEANWEFPFAGRGGWDVGDLTLVDGRMELDEPRLETQLRLSLRSGEPREGLARTPLRIEGEGRFRGEPVAVSGGVESPLELRDREQPYRLALRIASRQTEGRLRGTLHNWFDLSAFDLRLALEGPDLAALYPLLRLSLPATRPYRLEGQLVREGDRWRYLGIEGDVGESDLQGDVHIDASGDRTAFTAELASAHLAFVDLAGFLGMAPGEGEALRQQGRLFPDTPFDHARLLAMDADVQLRAERLTGAPFPAESLDAHLRLVDGRVEVAPLRMRMGGGEANGRLDLDAAAGGAGMAVALRLSLDRLSLPLTLGEDHGDGTQGRLAGQIALDGRGRSIADLAAASEGRLELAMGPGRIGPTQMAAWNLDGALPRRALGADREEGLAIGCAVIVMDVANGQASSRIAAAETPRVYVIADGGLDLGRERLDMTVNTRPRSAGLLALRAPVRVHGPWLSPEVDLDPGPLLLRGLAAAALYSVTPPAVLLALVETGDAQEVPCLQELRDAAG